ncbi:adenosine deaminase 2-A [Pelomyxa schiedti]|nr:adenosine deaminase 2-A [Pelomyxa schiedti]
MWVVPATITALVFVSLVTSYVTLEEYVKDREQLIYQEATMDFAWYTDMSQTELNAGEVWKKLLGDELARTQASPAYALPFREARDRIIGPYDGENQLLSVIRAMPKGALLHTHCIGCDSWFLINTGSYRQDCYINVGSKDSLGIPLSYTYAPSQPPNSNGSDWQRVVDLRKASGNVTQFDLDLYHSLQFYTPPGGKVTQDEMWVYFDSTIRRGISLLSFLPVFEAAVLNDFQSYVDDGIQHVELRGVPAVMDTGYNFLSDEEVIQLFLSLIDQFNNGSETKLSMTIIYAICRYAEREEALSAMQFTAHLMAKYPGFIVGFDLMDEEDRFHPLFYYINEFLSMENYTANNNLPTMAYFFHAGETTFPHKRNLYDALLLGTKRIGHGFALKHHPLLTSQYKEQGVLVEVCPISNQMLRLVHNLQDHTAVHLMRSGVPISINNDDPAIYGYQGVSYDWYEASTAWELTLRALKQLAINSIEHSSLTASSKSQLKQRWLNQWNTWISWLLLQQ